MKSFYVYILANKRNGTLYVGVTNDLTRRTYQHKKDVAEGFTKTYGVHSLVHYEKFVDVKTAIERERQLKRWKRQWKLSLIEENNPQWIDLYDDLVGRPLDSGFLPSQE